MSAAGFFPAGPKLTVVAANELDGLLDDRLQFGGTEPLDPESHDVVDLVAVSDDRSAIHPAESHGHDVVDRVLVGGGGFDQRAIEGQIENERRFNGLGPASHPAGRLDVPTDLGPRFTQGMTGKEPIDRLLEIHAGHIGTVVLDLRVRSEPRAHRWREFPCP